MNYTEFKNIIADIAKEENVKDYELYYITGTSISINAFEKEISSFDHNTTIGVSFRCVNDGKIGYASTQDLSLEEAKRLVLDAKIHASILDENPHTKIYEGLENEKLIKSITPADKDITDFLKQTALDIEKMALLKDDRVESVPYSIAEYSYSERAIFNSYGIDMHDSSSYYVIMCEVIAKDDSGRKYSGGEYVYFKNPKDVKIEDIVTKAVDNAIETIGAKKVHSDIYPIVFKDSVTLSFLSAFSSVFSSDSAQKGLSLLASKEGEVIASDIVNIVEDPMFEDSVIEVSFDDEGFKTYKKDIIKNGKLETLIYNLETASKADRKSTGNGMKSGYSSPVGVSFSNFYIEPGKDSLESLFEKANTGIYVTEVKGMHASAEPTSGDFSLEAKGFLIENGKKSYPVEQFTIAGNFFTMIKDITAISSDLLFRGTIGAPAILIKELSVAGEDE